MQTIPNSKLKSTLQPKMAVGEGDNRVIQPIFISQRACINRLWHEGLTDRDTWRSAIQVIANALRRCPTMTDQQRRELLFDWISRATTGYDDAMTIIWCKEAEKVWESYERLKYPLSDTCDNRSFRVAMRSACPDEFSCKLSMNRGEINETLLLRLGLWDASNSKPPGLGKAARDVYEAVLAIAKYFPEPGPSGEDAFGLSLQQIMNKARISKPTAIKWRRELVELGFIAMVRGGDGRAPLYILCPLTEEVVRQAVEEVRSRAKTKRRMAGFMSYLDSWTPQTRIVTLNPREMVA